METTKPVLSQAEKAIRKQLIDNTNASFALEGIEADQEMKALQQQYIDGEIENTQILGERTRKYLKNRP